MFYLSKQTDIPIFKTENPDSKWTSYLNLLDEKFPPDGTIHYCFPDTGGTWSGEKGNSVWRPNPDTIPQKDNPNGKTWEEIFEKDNIKSVEFKDGYPDFFPFSEIDVVIDDFTDNRQKNFAQADEKLAEQWSKENKDGKTDWKAQDIAQYRKEQGMTWHEHQDCKTLQLLPKEIHNNIPHSGGISVKKQASA